MWRRALAVAPAKHSQQGGGDMCGVTGFWGASDTGEQLAEMARCMALAAAHRGPDDDGGWADPEAGIALGHRRLSIIDLSPDGHQPMRSRSGRYVIAFNGEIYNFETIRRDVDAAAGRVAYRGHSDTEVMLAAIEAWGLRRAVERFVGMFAFALWDRHDRVLHLVRDRIGIKPLYYGWHGGRFAFGSELKMMRALPGFAPDIDRGALTLLLRHAYIPAPHTIYAGVAKLLPGSILSVRSPRSPDSATLETYWSARAVAEHGVAHPLGATDDEAIEQLDALLRDAVRLRMVADVPLGAFLSGGVDSSTVVALMQAQSPQPVRTFSIGSRDARADEARHARAVASHLGTSHTDLYVTPEDALDVVPRLPSMYDEPFADSSQIPTFLVSQLARRDVTVSLSGDGGDELFGGYNRHVWVDRIWRRIARAPRPLRRAVSRGLLAVSQDRWERLFRTVDPVLPFALRHRWPGYKLHKLAGVLPAVSPEAMYRDLASFWREPALVVRGGSEPTTLLTDVGGADRLRHITQRMMYLDLVTYLPDDILTKVDRASMAVSLEARVPLLDHRVVEFAWRVPLEMKIREGQSKWLLRQVLYRYVPRELIERPKEGFGIPLGAWLRGPLRDWGESLLAPDRLRREAFFDPRPIRRLWQAHQTGAQNGEHHLWPVLMFQAWYETQQRACQSVSQQLDRGVTIG